MVHIQRPLMLALLVAGTLHAAPTKTSPSIEQVLEHLAATADAYPGHGVTFACRETVRWRYFDDGGRKYYAQRKTFAYEVTRPEGGTIQGRREEAEASKPGTARGSRMPRAPMFEPSFWLRLFEEGSSDAHDFEIVGREEVLDRTALRIEFRPSGLATPSFGRWYGTAWVDAETLRLLRVEGTQAGELEAFRRMLDSEEIPADPTQRTFALEKVTTTFGIEKELPVLSGTEARLAEMAFPSQVEKEASRQFVKSSGTARKPILLYDMRQTYDDCEWRTEESATAAR